MSDENTARHAECTVEFDGVDITSSIAPYLLSLSFTDNEEDASDDLQIKLQDREGVWMTDWLQKMIDGDVSAASSDGYKVGDVVQFLGGPHYKASTDKKANGNPKAGPAKITIIKQGALHPYHVIHTDGTSRVYGWVDASEISGKSGSGSSGSSSGSGEESLKIRATITACNWHSDGKDEALDCGTFELDSVVASGPPGIITIKAIGLPYTSQIRQTKQSKGWEKYKLSGIRSSATCCPAGDIALKYRRSCCSLPDRLLSSYSPFSSHFASTPNASENLLMVSGFGCSSFRSYLPTREPDIPIFWPSCSIDRCCFFRVSLTLKPKFSVIPIDGRNVPIGISNACAIFWSASIFGVLTPRSYCWIVIVAISTFTASSPCVRPLI